MKNLVATVVIEENLNVSRKKQEEIISQIEKKLPEYFTGKVVFVGRSNGKRIWFAKMNFVTYDNGKRLNHGFCDICLERAKSYWGPVAVCETHDPEHRSLIDTWLKTNIKD